MPTLTPPPRCSAGVHPHAAAGRWCYELGTLQASAGQRPTYCCLTHCLQQRGALRSSRAENSAAHAPAQRWRVVTVYASSELPQAQPGLCSVLTEAPGLLAGAMGCRGWVLATSCGCRATSCSSCRRGTAWWPAWSRRSVGAARGAPCAGLGPSPLCRGLGPQSLGLLARGWGVLSHCLTHSSQGTAPALRACWTVSQWPAGRLRLHLHQPQPPVCCAVLSRAEPR